MARAQIYRGDPELKQVVLFDNFSGGMNTTDIDEQMGANEFRYLENVELMEQGRVGKRTGFGNLKIGRVLNIYGGINDVIHVDVLYDENNNFNIYDYDEFESEKVPHYIIIAVIRYNTNTKTMNMLELILRGRVVDRDYVIEVEEYSEEIETAEKKDDYEFYDKHMKITGLRTNNYNGKTYFLANQVIKNSDSVICYELGENKRVSIEISNKENSYAPNPYELTNIGFNVFSKSPLSHISSINQSEDSVSSLVLLDKDNQNIILSKIPTSGEFVVRVYYTGSELLKNQLEVKFYVESVTTERRYIKGKVTKTNTDSGKGYFDYLCALPVKTNQEVFIEVTKEIRNNPKDFADKILLNKDALIGEYINTEPYFNRNSPGFYGIKYGKAGTTYDYEYVKKIIYGVEYPDTVYEEFETNNMPMFGVAGNIQGNRIVVDLQGNNYFEGKEEGHIVAAILADFDEDVGEFTSDTYINVVVLKKFNLGSWDELIPVIYNEIDHTYENINVYAKNLTMVNHEFILKPTEPEILINQNYIYYLSDHDLFFEWNKGQSGTIEDFKELEITLNEEVINYTQANYVGVSDDKQIEPIKFNELKSSIIKDRLILYGGNTVVYSDIYSRQKDILGNEQGFTYFPNYNWFSLALETTDSIQSIVYYRGSYMIFTKKSIYRMSGEFNTDSFEIVMVSDVVGCVSPDSIRGMNNTIIFMSEDGLYTLKQNYYLDGLENVSKIDKNITGLIPYGENYESLTYNEQYWLFVKEPNGTLIKVIKQYYNLDLRDNQHPYTVDTYGTDHMLMFRNGIDLYVVYEGEFFKKGEGYLDFVIVEDIGTPYEVDWKYNVKIETPYWSFGYPLHEKKFKNVFLKVNSIRELPIAFDVLVDFGAAISSDHYSTSINSYGEVEYNFERKPTFITKGVGELGDMKLGKSSIGDAVYQVHKINPATKGKTIKFRFEQGSSSEFSVDAISIVYKLGKMRESR